MFAWTWSSCCIQNFKTPVFVIFGWHCNSVTQMWKMSFSLLQEGSQFWVSSSPADCKAFMNLTKQSSFYYPYDESKDANQIIHGQCFVCCRWILGSETTVSIARHHCNSKSFQLGLRPCNLICRVFKRPSKGLKTLTTLKGSKRIKALFSLSDQQGQ